MKQQVKSENALTHSIHQINSHRVMLSLKYLLEKRVSRNAFVGITRILASEMCCIEKALNTSLACVATQLGVTKPRLKVEPGCQAHSFSSTASASQTEKWVQAKS